MALLVGAVYVLKRVADTARRPPQLQLMGPQGGIDGLYEMFMKAIIGPFMQWPDHEEHRQPRPLEGGAELLEDDVDDESFAGSTAQSVDLSHIEQSDGEPADSPRSPRNTWLRSEEHEHPALSSTSGALVEAELREDRLAAMQATDRLGQSFTERARSALDGLRRSIAELTTVAMSSDSPAPGAPQERQPEPEQPEQPAVPAAPLVPQPELPPSRHDDGASQENHLQELQAGRVDRMPQVSIPVFVDPNREVATEGPVLNIVTGYIA